MDDILIEFFSKKYEEKVNKNILFYTFPEDEVREYVERLLKVPVDEYIDFIVEKKEREQVLSKDVFQFSNFDDATVRICEKLKEINNPGVKFLEAGKLLLDDGKERKDGAYIKYGENHLKVSEMLGFSFELCHSYYLSGIGYIFNELNYNKQNELLTRVILRSKLISRVFQASLNGKVELREFLYMLSDSTYIRRSSNIKRIFEYLRKYEDYSFDKYLDNIYLDFD